MAVMKTLLGRGPVSGSSMVVEDSQRIDNRSEQKPDNTKASKSKETGCFPGFSSSINMQGRFAQKMNLLLDSIAHTAKEREETTIWEFQHKPLGENWQTPFLPPNMKLVAMDDFYMQSLGKKPPVDWKPVKDTATDAEGWQYSGFFEGCFPGIARAHSALFSSSSHWNSRRLAFQNFRRRRLKPVMEGEVVVPEAVSPTAQIMERGPVKVVFEADLGILPLAALISALNADDWTADSPVSCYLKAVSASEVSFGAWTAGQNTSGISGKARTMEMRMPLQPAPMRPKDTRCTIIWHLIANPMKVALESVVTSYDVPYGTCFNVVKCDTFYLDEDSHIRYVRTVAMEWLKPCWVRAIVETNAFAEVGRDGAKMAEVVKQWLTDRRRCKI